MILCFRDVSKQAKTFINFCNKKLLFIVMELAI